MRTASCRCGRLTLECDGDPLRVSVCHCLACQQRTGSVLSAQARWPDDRLTLRGEWREWKRVADSGNRTTYRFCPTCGSTLTYSNESTPGVTAVPVGAFADPSFPPPDRSVYEERRHPWVAILGDEVEHIF